MNGTGPVKCSRDIVLTPDVALGSVESDEFDVVVLPGGLGGAEAFAASNLVKAALQKQEQAGRIIAAM